MAILDWLSLAVLASLRLAGRVLDPLVPAGAATTLFTGAATLWASASLLGILYVVGVLTGGPRAPGLAGIAGVVLRGLWGTVKLTLVVMTIGIALLWIVDREPRGYR